MVHVITVAATEGGWAVRHDVAANAMLFTSGAKAERAARKLGVTLAQTGAATEIPAGLLPERPLPAQPPPDDPALRAAQVTDQSAALDLMGPRGGPDPAERAAEAVLELVRAR